MNGAGAARPRLNDRQRLSWLRLSRTGNVGPASFRDLINRFGSAESALEMLPELVRNGGARAVPKIPTIPEAQAEIEAAEKNGAAFAAIGEPGYPRLLRTIPHPPPIIAVKGDPDVFKPPSVSIVGARNASIAGTKMAARIASTLGREGFAIVSGMARGIDAAAHRGSLATGTIAVFAGGLDRPYPPENIALSEEIAAEGGALVSEMPFGHEPRARDFPRRNRLVAGLGLGLVVVEAAKRSGSLISARLAGELGRLVFAVPGSPLDPRAEGTNGLLKDGAVLVTSAEDVIEHVAPLAGGPARQPFSFDEPPDISGSAPPAEDERSRVVEALGPVPAATDDIMAHTGLPAAIVHMVLLELDLAGRLERHSGGAVSLVSGGV